MIIIPIIRGVARNVLALRLLETHPPDQRLKLGTPGEHFEPFTEKNIPYLFRVILIYHRPKHDVVLRWKHQLHWLMHEMNLQTLRKTVQQLIKIVLLRKLNYWKRKRMFDWTITDNLVIPPTPPFSTLRVCVLCVLRIWWRWWWW